MTPWTTPTYILKFPAGIDMSLIKNFYFSLKQGAANIKKTGSEISVDGNRIIVELEQEETGRFVEGEAELQLNWTYAGRKRSCSKIVKVSATDNLLKEVVE